MRFKFVKQICINLVIFVNAVCYCCTILHNIVGKGWMRNTFGKCGCSFLPQLLPKTLCSVVISLSVSRPLFITLNVCMLLNRVDYFIFFTDTIRFKGNHFDPVFIHKIFTIQSILSSISILQWVV